MKEFKRRTRRRKTHSTNETTELQLLDVWKKQGGKRVYTNIGLVLPHELHYNSISNNRKVSLDRIYSSKPYSLDNIQFTSVTVNLTKNNMSESELFEFFEIVIGSGSGV